ncbi:DUF4422 domain-containing protein [Treponema berlinense]|uniref:DUF4422 domain-containing protein n=1 Tax=Treponema berlinense TaxID=225004 RepID=UPI0026EBFB36|nr:DUF4422 domain-containing protein [Treponema berlinense]
MKNKITLTKDNIKILICCHKPCELPPDPEGIFLPIQVGAAISDVDLGMQRDDQVNGKPCDNISAKNKSYCELTALYWAWKNIKKLYPNLEYIGLNHYRRYFSFESKLKMSVYEDNILNEKDILNYHFDLEKLKKLLKKNDCFIAKKHFYKFSMYWMYCLFYVSEDYRILKKTIQTNFSEYYKSFIRCMEKSNFYHPYNMFIMSYNDFDSYCSWLFSVLSKIENFIPFESYNEMQKRVFGYISEFLLLVWLKNNKKNYKEMMVNTYGTNVKKLSPIMQILKTLRSKLIFFILKHF